MTLSRLLVFLFIRSQVFIFTRSQVFLTLALVSVQFVATIIWCVLHHPGITWLLKCYIDYPARVLRALGLLLYSRIPQWEGRRLFDRSVGFFYGNNCNSETESQKIVPKVGNERSLLGLQMGLWPKLGSYGKNRIFWPKTKILGPKKKVTLLRFHHVLATPGKSCSKKKVAFAQIIITQNIILSDVWVKTHF